MAAATLYSAKPAFQRMLRPVVGRVARAGVQPNQLTAAAVVASAVAGVLVGTRYLLWVVPVLYATRLALNAMDGVLAREHGMATSTGAVLNEVGDVVSDAVAYLPFAILLPAHASLVVAVVALGLTAEVAALAGGPPRRNDGPLGKSDRALAFSAVAVATAIGFPVEPLLWPATALAAATVVNRSRAR